MKTVHQSVEIHAGATPPDSIDADLLFVPLFEQDPLDDVSGLNAATGGALHLARERGEVTGQPFELFLAPAAGWRVGRIAVIGAGPRSLWTTQSLRRFATAAG